MATFSEIENGKNLYIINPDGIKDLKERFPELELYIIYINSPERDRIKRALTKRRESVETVMRRIEAEKEQFSEFKENRAYDSIIYNVTGYEEETYRQFRDILLKNI